MHNGRTKINFNMTGQLKIISTMGENILQEHKLVAGRASKDGKI
jgi:hypothetical protein